MITFSDDQLLAMLDSLESFCVERKESFNGDTPTKIRETICAFANDLPNSNAPSVAFIGAKDNGHPSGITITDSLLCSLSDLKTDGNILPLPVLSVERRVLKGAEMAIITVIPSDMPPVKYRGRIWVRTGPRRSIANEQEERILIEKRRHKNIPFDIYPIPTATVNDLSRLIFENEFLPASFSSDILEENGRTYEERLASCKMISSPIEKTPTVLGLLSIGISPQDFLPGSYIQFETNARLISIKHCKNIQLAYISSIESDGGEHERAHFFQAWYCRLCCCPSQTQGVLSRRD